MTPAFALLDDLDDNLRPVLDPRIYVEPKDRGDATEYARQAAWVALMRRTARRCLVFAVPNGTNIASQAGRRKVHNEGLHTGFPDTGVAWTGASAFLEWKAGRGDPSDAQIECLNRLAAMEHPVAIVRTVDGAMRWLNEIGAPVPGVRG